MADILKREGLQRGLFAGYGAFLLRDLNFDIIEFVSYEQMKLAYRRRVCPDRELKPLEGSLLGAFAGGLTGAVTTPLDVIKTRLMLSQASGAGGAGASEGIYRAPPCGARRGRRRGTEHEKATTTTPSAYVCPAR